LHKYILSYVAAVFLLAAGAFCRADSNSPFDVGSKTQLFIDQHLVRDSRQIAFTLHQAKKHERNPLLKPDQPWERDIVDIYGSVLFDREEKLFKMWYQTLQSDYFDVSVTCYATSRDGIHWEKPLVGTLEAKNGKPHNAVARSEITSEIKDPSEKDPPRRYKSICFIPDQGYMTMISPDGLHWSMNCTEAIAPIAHVDDVICGFWDAPREQYLAFAKLQYPVRGRLRRTFWSITSRDFQHWTKPELAFAPDRRDDDSTLARLEEVRSMLTVPDRPKVLRTEFYQISAYPMESGVVAFPMVFSANANVSGNQDGISELQIAFSRDLEQWERPFRTPCLARGPAGSWDSGFFTAASEAIRVGDEIRLYYGGSNYTHGAPCVYDRAESAGTLRCRGEIGLATWKLDRFVSADGPAEGGTLTTIPLRFRGKRLEINAAAKRRGTIQVELLDAGGKPIEGFGKSDAFTGDDLRHTVAFGGKSDVSKLAGRPICLRFHLANAELFSFAFRE
jgi:hypothetical protein